MYLFRRIFNDNNIFISLVVWCLGQNKRIVPLPLDTSPWMS
jgi:hypothetical protein